MALFLRQDDNRSEMQKRLAAELQDKAKKKHELENQPERPDGVKDARYMDDFAEPSRYLWVWLVLAVATIGTIIAFIALG
ncbi:MAG: hypothetical protein ABIR91_04275 [Candidatus Saccharimonadales bacterium]